MPISITHSLPLSAAQRAMPLLASLLSWRSSNLAADQGAALVVPENERPQVLGVDAEFLLLVLPDDLAAELDTFAATTFRAYNRDSADLLSRQTFLSLHAEQN